jgi:hypothetical protein
MSSMVEMSAIILQNYFIISAAHKDQLLDLHQNLPDQGGCE